MKVQGHCPMGCGETLFLTDEGHVNCDQGDLCDDPAAVSRILSEDVFDHVVELHAKTFTVLHPLRERLQRELLDCDLAEWLKAQSGPPVPPGRYYAVEDDGDWIFSKVNP